MKAYVLYRSLSIGDVRKHKEEKMAVIRTNKWGEMFLKHVRAQKDSELTYQRLFAQPLQPLFQFGTDTELAMYLEKVGLFTIKDTDALSLFITKNYWSVLQEKFLQLKEAWNGPNVPVYLLLANEQLKKRQTDVKGMMGLSFQNGIVLIVPETIEVNDLFALLIHEYHHVCRLSHTKENEETITLLESMVMEGLAELAVKEWLGEAYLAPWTSLYDKTWNDKWAVIFIHKKLQLKGRRRYKDHLYGNAKKHIPPMLGYYFGYQLCQQAASHLKEETIGLLTTPAEKNLSLWIYRKWV